MPTASSLKLGRTNEIVARAIIFVAVAGTSERVRAELMTKGYTVRVRAQFWACIHEVCQFRQGASSAQLVRATTQQISSMMPSLLRVSRASLKNDYPEQHDFVFENLEPGSGTSSLVGMKMFLDRLDQLESGNDREATRKADSEALDKLAERGTTPEERQRLRGLLTIALIGLDDTVAVATPATAEAMKRLAGMVEEWTEIARVVVSHRSDLIQLGVIRRRKARKQDQVIVAPPMEVGSAPMAPAPTPTAMPASAPRGLLAPSVPPPPVPTITDQVDAQPA